MVWRRSSGITESLLLLLVVPPFVAGLCLVFFTPQKAWAPLLAGLGLIGLGVAGWIDLADNCVVGDCPENDPLLLSAIWAVSVACVLAGGVGGLLRASTRR